MDAGDDECAADDMESMLRRAQAKDPEHAYRVASKAAWTAEIMEDWAQVDRYRAKSAAAKRMLPQFNLEGLWVGK